MIVIEEYNHDWPRKYEQERAAVIDAIGPYIADIEHVGSTSVPGLAAKPVVDIGISLNTYPLPTSAITRMEQLGYEYMGEYGIAGREYFRKGNPRLFNLHAYSPGNPEWEAHILFRNYLRAHPEAAKRYELLKRELAARHTNVDAYAEDKTDFVLATLNLARQE